MNSPLSVGCVPYINALPFYLFYKLHQPQSLLDFTFSTPQKLNQLLREEALDVALTSCVEHFSGHYERLETFGIAAEKKVLSVNLYTKLPLSSLSGQVIRVTEESATSVALLKVLALHFWKIEISCERLDRNEPFTKHPAFLLIGDEALCHQHISNYHTIDLAESWYQMTQLPFVFALFLFRKNLNPEKIVRLQNEIDLSYQWSLTNPSEVIRWAHQKSQASLTLLERYFSFLNHRLDERALRGLQTFKQLLKEVKG